MGGVGVGVGEDGATPYTSGRCRGRGLGGVGLGEGVGEDGATPYTSASIK